MNRRNVLQSIGASATALMIGSVGAVGAEPSTSVHQVDYEERASVKRPYTSPDAAQSAIVAHGRPVLELLDQRGLLSERGLAVEELDKDAGTWLFAHDEDGTVTAHLVTEYEIESSRVEIHVLPEAGRSFAYVFEGSDGSSLKIDPEYDDPVRPMKDCSTSSDCVDDGCSHWNTTTCRYDEYRCCLYPDGSYECERTDSSCDTCCCC